MILKISMKNFKIYSKKLKKILSIQHIAFCNKWYISSATYVNI